MMYNAIKEGAKIAKKYIQNVEFAIQNLIGSVEHGDPYDPMKLRIAQLNGEKSALVATLTPTI